MRHRQAIGKLSRVLREHFGDDLANVLVFGSVAKGRDTNESDIDIMVDLRLPPGAVDWKTERRIRDLVYPIELEDDVVLDLKVTTEADLAGLRGHTPFMERVRADGIAVWRRRNVRRTCPTAWSGLQAIRRT